MSREFNQATLQALAMSSSQRANAVNIYDTIASCWVSRERGIREYTQRYIEGKYPPHYPVPAKYIYIAIEPKFVVTLENDGTGYGFNNPRHKDDGFWC